MSNVLTAQWQNPRDILSVLLLLGPEVIQDAVAQLAGRWITPVPFSFGWVAFAVRALSSAVGGNAPSFYCFIDSTMHRSAANLWKVVDSCPTPICHMPP